MPTSFASFTASSHSSSSAAHGATSLHRDINKRIVDASSAERILEIVERSSHDFNAVNISTAFHRLAKMWHNSSDDGHSFKAHPRMEAAIQKLTELALLHIREFQGQGLGIIVWAYAKIGYDPAKITHLLEGFAQEAVDRLSGNVRDAETTLKLGAQSLSNMVYAYAVLGHHPGAELLSAIAKGVQWQLRDFSPQGLSNIVWAYAKLGALVSQEVLLLLEALAVEAVSQLMDIRSRQKFIPQNLSNMLYGYAVLGYNPGQMLMIAIAKEAQRQLHDFGPQELTNMVWAFAKLGGPLSEEACALLDMVPAEVTRQLTDEQRHLKVKPQTMSNMLWAYATLNRSPKRLLGTLAAEALRQLNHFKPQELSNTLWAYAMLDYNPGPQFLGEVCLAILKQISMFKPQELGNALWAFATLRHHPGDSLMSSALAEACRQLDKFKPQELSNLMWAAAKLGQQVDANILDAVAHLTRSWTQGFKAQDVCNLMWGLAVLEGLQEEGAALLAAKCAALPPEDFTHEALVQICQVQLALPAGVSSAAQQQLGPLLHLAEAAWRQCLTEAKLTKAHKEVSAALAGLGVAHALEAPSEDGLITADIALQGQAQATALSIDGATHFCDNAPYRPLGKTLLRWRMLTSRGWKVLSVPFYAWNALHSGAQRAAYLDQLLQSPGSSLPLASPFGLQQQQQPHHHQPHHLHQRLSPPGHSHAPYPTTDALTQQLSQPNHPFHTYSLPLNLGAPQSGAELANGHGPAAYRHSSYDHGGPFRLDPAPGGEAAGLLQPQSHPNYIDNSLADRFNNLSPFGLLPVGSPSDTTGLSSFPPGSPYASSAALAAIPLVANAASLAPPQAHPSSPYSISPAGKGSAFGVQQPPFHHQAQQQSLYQHPFQAAPPPPPPQQQQPLPSQGSMPSSRQPSPRLPPLLPASQALVAGGVAGPGSAASSSGRAESAADLRRLWQCVTQVEPGQKLDSDQQLVRDAALSVAEVKRVIETLPLEKSAVSVVAPRLAALEPPEFATLLRELARDNHAFRAWQLFDWVRGLPEGHELQRLCDGDTYTAMIALCGPWQQLRRALQLIADMRQRGIETGLQAYTALLNAAVKCGESELAIDVYRQMQAEGLQLDRPVYHTVMELYLKLGRWEETLALLEEMRRAGLVPEVQSYNLMIVTCTKLGQPSNALAVYDRMVADGVAPNTKTFTALIGAFSKFGPLDKVLDIFQGVVAREAAAASEAGGGGGTSSTYAALMSACEKAGQWDLAVALFDKVSAQGCAPDVSIFNSMIAACAHGGEYNKARAMFERMSSHGCAPDAVTYANLIRAYKKGGQWCHAVHTFERMQASGCNPHAAVYSSVIDVLWQTGVVWAQARAVQLFSAAVRSGCLAGVVESAKKATLKVDLQALTVGVAILSMDAWLAGLREQLHRDCTAPALDANRKLAVVNGMGDHSRAQGNSSAVKEAVGASLIGARAPFRLVQDHSRSGRLEANTLTVKKWLFSEAFERYHAAFYGPAGPAATVADTGELKPTEEYLEVEAAEAGKCGEMWDVIRKYEAGHVVSLKVLHAQPGAYLQKRKQLVALALHLAHAMSLTDQVAHAAVALMDATMMSGVHMTDKFETLFIAACLRTTAGNEGGHIPSPEAVGELVDYPGIALGRMEANIAAVLHGDTACISALHCLKVYAQRLGVDLSDGDMVQRCMGGAFLLATDALADVASLQYPPSLTAAAVLHASRRAQGAVPFWPTVLALLTGYNEASSSQFASAIAHVDRLAAKLFAVPEPPHTLGL